MKRNIYMIEADNVWFSILMDLDKDDIPKECHKDLRKISRYITKLEKIARKLDKLN